MIKCQTIVCCYFWATHTNTVVLICLTEQLATIQYGGEYGPGPGNISNYTSVRLCIGMSGHSVVI